MAPNCSEQVLSTIHTCIHPHEQHLQLLSSLPQPPFLSPSSFRRYDHQFAVHDDKLDKNYAHPAMKQINHQSVKCQGLRANLSPRILARDLNSKFTSYYQPWLKTRRMKCVLAWQLLHLVVYYQILFANGTFCIWSYFGQDFICHNNNR